MICISAFIVSIVAAVLTGVIIFLWKQNEELMQMAKVSSKAIEELLEKRRMEEEEETVCRLGDVTLRQEMSSDEEWDEDYRLPYFTDSEEEEDSFELLPSQRTSSSGYDTTSDCDLEAEICDISDFPSGPAPDDQVLLVLRCAESELYVKVVIDKEESTVFVFTYERQSHGGYEWKGTTCPECIEEAKRCLAERGCRIPMFVHAELSDIEEEEEEDIEGVAGEFGDDAYFEDDYLGVVLPEE